MKAAMVAVRRTGAKHDVHHHDAGTRTLERNGAAPEVQRDTERSRPPPNGGCGLPAGDADAGKHPARASAQTGVKTSRAALLVDSANGALSSAPFAFSYPPPIDGEEEKLYAEKRYFIHRVRVFL